MTREMRPSHRIDILTDAALHYGRHSAKKLGMYYCIQYNCSGLVETEYG